MILYVLSVFIVGFAIGWGSAPIYDLTHCPQKCSSFNESTIGEHPQNFMIDHKGEYIFVANRDNGHIVIFRRNQSTGELTYTGTEVIVPRMVCLTQFFVN